MQQWDYLFNKIKPLRWKIDRKVFYILNNNYNFGCYGGGGGSGNDN